MEIDQIKLLCKDTSIEVTQHILMRCQQRKISYVEIKEVIKSGEIIEEYASILSAAKSNGVIASNISRSIKTGIKCGGFLWKYKEQND